MTPTIQSETSTPQAPGADLQLAALLSASALSPLADVGWIRVTGEDRVRWLNGMVTNSIQELHPGHGNYNFLLNAQGRIQGDAHIFAETGDSEALLLETALTQVPHLITLLDRFIIMDDVELTDISSSRSGLLVAGPQASALLESLLLPTSDLVPLQLKISPWRGSEVTLIHAYSPLIPRFELWADAETIASLAAALHEAGATSVTQPALEDLRILEGTPRYGTDIRDRDLPQETVQTRALHFAKGCYLGQEIVERIRSRGNVHRTFTAFRLEGALPAAATLLEAEGKQVGELTSVSSLSLPNQHVQLALGYARREALDRNLPLTYPGGIAIPIPMPFTTVPAG